jgi:hypothetical protein
MICIEESSKPAKNRKRRNGILGKGEGGGQEANISGGGKIVNIVFKDLFSSLL